MEASRVTTLRLVYLINQRSVVSWLLPILRRDKNSLKVNYSSFRIYGAVARGTIIDYHLRWRRIGRKMEQKESTMFHIKFNEGLLVKILGREIAKGKRREHRWSLSFADANRSKLILLVLCEPPLDFIN